MNCTKCGNEAVDTDNFCGNCGKSLSSTGFSEGDGSINITDNNTITNSHFHVNNVYPSENQEERAYINRTYVKPVTIAGSPVKISWLIISGFVGFIGSLASIFSVLGSSWQFLFLIALALSMLLFMNGIILWKTRFSKLKCFNLESNKDGEVFFTKVAGLCPKCDGNLRLVKLKVSQNNSKTFVRCSRNGDHIWNFDPTVLD